MSHKIYKKYCKLLFANCQLHGIKITEQMSVRRREMNNLFLNFVNG
jgi:hypothetical protein